MKDLMKLPLIVISVVLFFFCLIVFGLRGLDAAIMSVLTFLGGVRVGQKQEAVHSYIDGLVAKTKKFFSSTTE